MYSFINISILNFTRFFAGPATAAPPAAAGGDNTETIRMLAGEVVRLRALVEQKRASIDGRKPPQQA